MSAITLNVKQSEDGAGWQAALLVDDQSVSAPIEIAATVFSSLAEHSRSLLDQFESGRRPFVEPAALHSTGPANVRHMVFSVWPRGVPPVARANGRVLIRSPHPEILNLPWELVELNGDTPLGCDPAWSLRRTPLDVLVADEPLEPGPLRILFCARSDRSGKA